MKELPMAEKPKSASVHPGPGCRIRSEAPRPPRAEVEELRLFETADLSDLLNRLYAMSPAVHNLVNDRCIAGPACTVKVYPGDNLMVHKALDIAKPGDVIVVDASNCHTTAVIGDLVARKAQHRGIEAFVIDGLVRDLAEMKAVGLPVYAKGVTPVGPLHRGPGEINHPICCGGVVVNPGDVIVGDLTGVVVVPRDYVTQTIERAHRQRIANRDYVDDVRRGIFSNAWVDPMLADLDCLIE